MDKIEELIRYNQESEYLDFKQQEYKDAVKPHLLKDVLAFANAFYTGDRYIIIGIKKDTNGIVAYDIQNPLDSANIQQYILANITPPLDITYEPYIYETKTLMILTIKDAQNKPYLIKKTVKIAEKIFLKEGEIWSRKGSHQLPASRDDLDRMYQIKYEKEGLEGKINITFENGTTTLEIACVKNIHLPSDVQKTELENSIRKKEAQGDSDDANIRILQNGGKLSLSDISSRETLQSQLKDVKMHFKGEDNYYLYEQRSVRLNFRIMNNGQSNLDGALLEVRIPKLDGLVVADHIYQNTASMSIVHGIFKPERLYPKVSAQTQNILVKEEFTHIRHQMPVEAFKEPLRIFADEKLAGQQLKIRATMHGKNLKKPQEFELTVSFA